VEDYAEIADFIASFQQSPETRFGNIGVQTAQIEDFLKEFEIRFCVQRDEGRIMAAIGVDHDPEIKRTWFHGPFVAASNWSERAEALWDSAVELVPPETKEIEIAFCTDNSRVATFCEQHGFEVMSRGRLMTFPQHALGSLPDESDISELTPGHHDALVALHDELFPRVWPNGRQMLARMSDTRRVFVATSGEALLGYIYSEVLPDHGEGGIEHVGVSTEARGRGLARALVAKALRWMLAFPKVEEIELYVRDDNEVAARLYLSVGFVPSVRLVGAHLQWAGTASDAK
jgi:ribosomal protein S18 acetylase RimI-like enzyme